MYNIGEYLVYKNEVCIIKEIKQKYFNNIDYYVLNPIDDLTLKINVPVENKLGYIKKIMTKQEAIDFINNMLEIDILDIADRNIENEYKRLLSTGEKEDLVSIIKTTYIRNKKRKDESKKIGEKDDEYFKKAEKLLYNELAISLNMSIEEVKKFIITKLSKDFNENFSD